MPIKKENRIPAHPPILRGYFGKEPVRWMLMTPLMCTVGALGAFFFSAVIIVVIMPLVLMHPPASTNWIPYSDEAIAGRAIYLSNGCVYCHSSYSRPQDYFRANYYLFPRVSEPGDYWEGEPSPNIFGTMRTGPDLSQEGGQHPEGWHMAHYWSPRATTPFSIMPRFLWLNEQETKLLIAHNQASGGKDGLLRYSALYVGGKLMGINMGMVNPMDVFPDLVKEAQSAGTYNANGKPSDSSPSGLPWKAVWMLNSFERGYWLTPDPLPATENVLLKGKEEFLKRCSGCHGAQGNGMGAAASFLSPPPFDFTADSQYSSPFTSDGDLYHRILTAGPGTAMENFGTRLSVENIWRIVLFLRTIPNGSLATVDTVPTMEMFKPWSAPDGLLKYIDNHPIKDSQAMYDPASNPFATAATWLAPGLAPGDTVMIGGKLPMDLDHLETLIKNYYFSELDKAYNDTLNRGTAMPSKDQVMSTEGLVFHQP